jgi:hypothetical protein
VLGVPVASLQYNRAIFALNWLRANRYVSPLPGDSVAVVRFELNTALNFNVLTGIETLRSYLHLCEARLLVIEGDFDRAASALASARKEAPFSDKNYSDSSIDLEIAYCKLKQKKTEEAIAVFQLVDVGSFSDLDIDDQFVLISILHEMTVEDPRFGDAALVGEHRDELRDAYLTSHQALRSGLDRFRADHPDAFTS